MPQDCNLEKVARVARTLLGGIEQLTAVIALHCQMSEVAMPNILGP